MSDDYGPVFLITGNVTGFKRFGNLRIRNLVEGAAYSALTYYLISLIPFVPKVQMIVTICLCAVILLGSIIGYKNQSPLELVINIITERMYTHEYRMRSINDEEGKEILFSNTGTGESVADKVVKKIQEYKKERSKI